MLSTLYIKNLAIIDELYIDFSNGLNIITGETGSGKSLIILAVDLLAGKSFSKEMIRSKKDEITIEGLFKIENDNINILRSYNSKGQTKSFHNNKAISKSSLIKLTKKLLDLHGQHEHQNLLNNNSHIKYLDLFGNYSKLIDEVNMIACDIELKKNKLLKLYKQQEDLESREKLRNFEIEELSLNPLDESMEKQILTKYSIASNLEKLNNNLNLSLNLIDNDDISIKSQLNKLLLILNNLSDLDTSILSLSNIVSSLIIEIEDLYSELSNKINNNVIEDIDFLQLNETIQYYETIKRKYGGSLKVAKKYYNELLIEDNIVTGNIEKIEELNLKIEKLKNKYNIKAKLLTKERKEHAKIMEDNILLNLKKLGMKDFNFKIKFSIKDKKYCSDGVENCEYFIRSNKGEMMYPLAKIGSGGEISRIMLAIKNSIQKKDIIGTLIFDEIDAGISGTIADSVGEHIEILSKTYQIICVTHLSQIASKGKNHFKIFKKESKNRIIVEIDKLNKKDRINEIAKLISAKEITESSTKQAKLLLKNG